MSDKRQKNQLELAFRDEVGVKPRGLGGKGPNRSWRSATRKPG